MSLRNRVVLALSAAALLGGAFTAPAVAAAPAPAAPAATAGALGPCNYSGSHPTIRQGSQGAPVAHAQCLLRNVWGYGGVDVDGIFGPRTRSAVIDMQRRCGIAQDGIVGPNTWNCLHP